MEEQVTLKQFAADVAVALVVSFIFGVNFVYLIPSVAARVGYDESKMRDAHRAEAYHQYLIRKGVIND